MRLLYNVSERLPENMCMQTLFLKTVIERFDVKRCIHVPIDRLHVLVNGLFDRGNYLTTIEDVIRGHWFQETMFYLTHMKGENRNFRRGRELEKPIRIPRVPDV